MSSPTHDALRWAPRVLGVLAALFLGAFALDAFGDGRGFWAALPGFLVHLVPAILLLAIVAVAWHRPLVGGVAFLSFATLYAVTTLRRPDWVLVISGPLAVVGALYVLSWRDGRRTGTPGR